MDLTIITWAESGLGFLEAPGLREGERYMLHSAGVAFMTGFNTAKN
jgi:hypothetical protein